jgi:hypothetical protein
MTKEEFDNIIKDHADLKNLPNTVLVRHMDLLSENFEETKKSLINLTMYLDKVEELYNKTLKEYQSRGNE